MLRRSFPSSPSSSACSLVASFSAHIFSTTRSVVFTQQHDQLSEVSKQRGFKSPVWVEMEGDQRWLSNIGAQLKPGEETKATRLPVNYIFDIYNLDCVHPDDPLHKKAAEQMKLLLQSKPADKPAWQIEQPHRSVANYKSAFHKDTQIFLKEVSAARGYKSKWWVPSRVVRMDKIQLVSRAHKETNVLLPGNPARPATLYNAEQFEDSPVITQMPVSAYKRRPYAQREVMVQASRAIAASNGAWETGLFFSIGQLEHFGLLDDLQDGAAPVEVTRSMSDAGSKDRVYYSADEIEGASAVLEEQGLPPVAAGGETYAKTGRLVLPNSVIHMEMVSHYDPVLRPSRYWMSALEVELRGLKLKPGATAVVSGGAADAVDPTAARLTLNRDDEDGGLHDHETLLRSGVNKARSASTTVLFSVHQLQDPNKGFRVAGTKMMI